jgi:hypothetical protein
MVQNNAASTQMTDIHDIKPLESIGIDPALFHYILYGAMAIILFGLLITLFLYFKKRNQKKAASVVPISPDEAALTAINDLAGRMDGNKRVFYFDLSTILRGYIHHRFNIGSLEMTTEELLPAVDNINLDRNLRAGLRSFIISSDPVKFAGYPVSTEKMESDLLFVKNFVKQTTSRNENG